MRISYPNWTREEILEALRGGMKDLAGGLGVERAILFGSYATGDFTVASDVDLLVVYRPNEAEDVYRRIKGGVDVRRLEPHLVPVGEYARRRAHFDRMTEGGVLVYSRSEEAASRVRDVLKSRSEVVFAYLFGSRGRSEALPHGQSDLDAGVYLNGEEGRVSGRERLSAWSDLHAELVRALSDLIGPGDRGGAPEGVDLVVLNDAPPLLSDRVLRTGRLVLSRSEPTRLRWATGVKSRYCDLRRLRRQLDRTVSERLRDGRFGRPAASGAQGPKGRREADRGGS